MQYSNLVVCSSGGKEKNFHNYIFEYYKINPEDTKIIEVENYPDPLMLMDLINLLKKFEFKNIFSIGGGSVLDTAKILSAFLNIKESLSLSDLENYKKYLKLGKKIRLTSIPTTCGTGAEVTQFATVWDRAQLKKYSIDHPNLLPDEFLLDGKLLDSLNYNNFLFPALDCVSHTIESIWNKNRTEESLEFSKNSLNIIKDEIFNFTNSNFKNVNFDKMLLASNYAGKAINITRTSIAHAISYKYTLEHDVPHGLACSFTLPKIHQYTLNNLNDDIYSDFANTIDLILNQILNLDLNSLIKSFTMGNKVIFLENDINLSRSNTFIGDVTPQFINSIIN